MMRRLILILFVPLLAWPQDADPPQTNEPTDFPFQVKIRSSSGRDRVAIGNSVEVKEGEEVKDLVVIGGSATVNGTVSGDFVVVCGKATLGPKAVVERDLVVVAGVLDAHPDAVINGEQTVVGMNTQLALPAGLRWFPQWVSDGVFMGRPLPHRYAWAWIISGIFIVLYLLLALLFPAPIRACVNVLETRPGTSLLTGLLALLLVGPLILLLLATVVGIIVVPFLICGGVAAYFFGKAVVYAYAGQQIVGKRVALLLPVLIGAILFTLLYAVPVLGFLVWGVAAPLGLGAVLLAFFGRLRKEEPKPPTAEPPGATVPAPPPTGTAMAVPMSALPPRAGFWLRFLGTMIDAVLVVTVCRLFRAEGPVLLGIWTLYHIALWSFKGATIGGLVVGTRIVRTDGGPIDIQVAIVRSLASFLSAAAFMLGFFWAGWNPQKQSWQDIIAGTYVVKTRPSVQPSPLPAPANQ